MKKLFLLFAIVAMVLPSCEKINDAIDELGNRLDKLEQESIPTIDEQIVAINTTLTSLDAMDKELKGYIDGLTATAANLQEQINATNTKIDEVKSALQGEISTAKAEVLAKLEAAKTELEGELAQINTTILTLQAKDVELDGKIADLKTYVDTELGKTTDWVNATFATLEQYNALVSEVATIKTTVENNKSEAATNLANAITALETSLKSWVGEQLSNYYTIAEVEAKIEALQNAIVAGNTSLQEELNNLTSKLETIKTEITEAYKKAIKEAIDTNDGVVDTKIANEIAAVNTRIESELVALNTKITNIESRLDKVESDVAALLKRIQSVSYIPQYSDGKATVYYSTTWNSYAVLDFEIKPNDVIRDIADFYSEICCVKAVYTQTRAVEFVDLPIIACSTDAENGVLSLTVLCDNLSEDFFAGTQSVSARFSIANESSNISSAYVPMVAKEEFQPNNHIWYTSIDGTVVTPTNPEAINVNISSNTYKNGRGVLTFDAPITSVGASAFIDNAKITSISLPEGVTSIGVKAFYNCSELVTATIPASVINIYADAFDTVPKLTSLRGPLASEDNRSLIIDGELVVFAYSGLTEYSIPNGVTKIGY